MKHFIIGTAGHIDHGKTSLIRALTGIDTDRLEEEKRRGITIDLGFTSFMLPNGEKAGIVDVPGHEKFIRNMLAGVGGMDLVLLVVAANEGLMPQTREHLDILSILKVKKGITVLTKTDLVEPEWLELVIEEVKEELRGTFMEDAPIVPISAVTGEGIDELKDEIARIVENVSSRNIETSMRMPIDRVFTISGFGTIITGTQLEGVMSVGDEVMLYPTNETVRVRNLQVHGENVQSSFAGQRVAVNVSNIKKEIIERGYVLAQKDSLQETTVVHVKLDLLKRCDKVIMNRTRVRFYQGTSETIGRINLLDCEHLRAGESCYVQLWLEKEVVVKTGDYFVLRSYSPMETIGGGIVLDPKPIRRKRYDENALRDLRMIETGTAEDIIECHIKKYKDQYHPLKQIIKQVSISEEDAEMIVKDLVLSGRVVMLTKEWGVHCTALKQIESKLRKILQEYHKQFPLKFGMGREELRSRLYLGKVKQADAIINFFLKEGAIRQEGQTVSLDCFQVTHSKTHLKLKSDLEEIFHKNKYLVTHIPDVAKLFREQKDAVQVVQSMVDEGILVRVEPQGCIHIQYYDGALLKLQEYVGENGSITVAEFRDLIGANRKSALQILEYFDCRKITRKVGDVRVIVNAN